MSDQISEGLFSPSLRAIRIQKAFPFINGRVLDVGCGSGELAPFFPVEAYWGFDPDEQSINHAKEKFPQYSFSTSLPESKQKFDTIVLLAVIEHITDPAATMNFLKAYLVQSNKSSIILTTPTSFTSWIHFFGAHLGLFSLEADHEHKILFNHETLTRLTDECDMELNYYKRFMLRLNQLAVFRMK
ncbi:MAG: class I SAM-dependent methyltransferase [Anaerolineaceae bacterium]